MNIFIKLASFFNHKQPENTTTQTNSSSLVISKDLKDFLENEVLIGLNISKDHFWSSFETIVNEFSPRNKDLLQKRDDIQAKIDTWHIDRKG